jgi:hypothetical protein
MDVLVKIKTCKDCRHLSHTGAFTVGGAKPCCDHDQTCEKRGMNCFKRTIPNLNKIPSWCPLKVGAKY